MWFNLPFNDDIVVRVGERVETTDSQYDIVDFGLEYGDGTIDSIAVGGSFSTLKKWSAPKDSKKRSSKKRKKAKAKAKAKAKKAKLAPLIKEDSLTTSDAD